MPESKEDNFNDLVTFLYENKIIETKKKYENIPTQKELFNCMFYNDNKDEDLKLISKIINVGPPPFFLVTTNDNELMVCCNDLKLKQDLDTLNTDLKKYEYLEKCVQPQFVDIFYYFYSLYPVSKVMISQEEEAGPDNISTIVQNNWLNLTDINNGSIESFRSTVFVDIAKICSEFTGITKKECVDVFESGYRLYGLINKQYPQVYMCIGFTNQKFENVRKVCTWVRTNEIYKAAKYFNIPLNTPVSSPPSASPSSVSPSSAPYFKMFKNKTFENFFYYAGGMAKVGGDAASTGVNWILDYFFRDYFWYKTTKDLINDNYLPSSFGEFFDKPIPYIIKLGIIPGAFICAFWSVLTSITALIYAGRAFAVATQFVNLFAFIFYLVFITEMAIHSISSFINDTNNPNVGFYELAYYSNSTFFDSQRAVPVELFLQYKKVFPNHYNQVQIKKNKVMEYIFHFLNPGIFKYTLNAADPYLRNARNALSPYLQNAINASTPYFEYATNATILLYGHAKNTTAPYYQSMVEYLEGQYNSNDGWLYNIFDYPSVSWLLLLPFFPISIEYIVKDTKPWDYETMKDNLNDILIKKKLYNRVYELYKIRTNIYNENDFKTLKLFDNNEHPNNWFVFNNTKDIKKLFKNKQLLFWIFFIEEFKKNNNNKQKEEWEDLFKKAVDNIFKEMNMAEDFFNLEKQKGIDIFKETL